MSSINEIRDENEIHSILLRSIENFNKKKLHNKIIDIRL